MTLVDLIFHYGGDWITSPHVHYSKKLSHIIRGYDSELLSYKYLVDLYINELGNVGVQQLIVNGPSGTYYEIENDDGIRHLLCLISDEFKILHFYTVDDCEQSISVTNIVNQAEYYIVVNEVGTDCSDHESESNSNSEELEYDSDELQTFANQKKREILPGLDNYKALYKGMSFKDIPEARKYINLYALANKKELKLLKSAPERLRYGCVFDCPFVVLVSPDGDLPGVRVKTLKDNHTCDEAFENSRVDYYSIAKYFKKKVQDNPKFMIKEMRVELKNTFNVNVSYAKCKRAKRLILEKLDGSFTDDYNRLEAYANELRGLIEAVQIVLPDSHHRFCVKHIEANWCKRWRTNEFKKLLWWSAWSSYEEDFMDQLKSIGELSKEASESLLKYPPEAWCRAYFDTVCKNQKVENNFTESVNAWLVEARQKPIIRMLEEIRIKLMNQLRERDESVSLWAQHFSPHSLKLYNEYLKIANISCYVDGNGDNGYEVREGEKCCNWKST